MAERKLTPKQELFVHAYCSNGFNAKRAAITAGYSEKTAKEIGCENLTKPNVKAAIDIYKAKLRAKNDVTSNWVVKQLRLEATREEEGATHSGRIAALKILTDYTGDFDKNRINTKTEHVGADGAPLALNQAILLTDEQLASIIND